MRFAPEGCERKKAAMRRTEIMPNSCKGRTAIACENHSQQRRPPLPPRLLYVRVTLAESASWRAFPGKNASNAASIKDFCIRRLRIWPLAGSGLGPVFCHGGLHGVPASAQKCRSQQGRDHGERGARHERQPVAAVERRERIAPGRGQLLGV